MRTIIVDRRPKWHRRLQQHPIYRQAWILLESTATWAIQIVLYPSDFQDTWSAIVEEGCQMEKATAP